CADVHEQAGKASRQKPPSGRERERLNVIADPADQISVLRHNHAASPDRQILEKPKAVDSGITDGAQMPPLFDGAEALRGIFNKPDPMAHADVAKTMRARCLAVQMCDQNRVRFAVD